MHFLGFGSHPYPALPFGTARVWDMGVTWKDVAPSPSSSYVGEGSPGLRRLDAIIARFRQHHVQPVVTLGMTPAWAARSCKHVVNGVDWGSQTCAPRDISSSGPWGRYVRGLAQRYRSSVRYFELWNEPSLHNGWNDSVTALAQMQQVAAQVLHAAGHGQKLIAPSIPFTDGGPAHGLSWLNDFLGRPGGTDFDVAGFHLYPTDDSARAGAGPEWSMDVALPAVKAVLDKHGVADRPIWNTETNVGRVPAGVTFSGLTGAGMVARTFILGTEAGVRRIIWYAADDRSWGGTWLENANLTSLTNAGSGYLVVRDQLLGKVPLGCSRQPSEANGERYTCKFGTAAGAVTLLALWTTGRPFATPAPAATSAWYTLDGARHAAFRGRALTVGKAPIFVLGSVG